MATQQTIRGKTPNGGVKSTAFFSDGKGNSVDKSEATHVEITELDDKGKVVGRTYGRV